MSLFSKIKEEQGRLDVLVNVFWGGPLVTQWGDCWLHPIQSGREVFNAAWPHVLTSRFASGLMVERRSGLIVQLTEGDGLFYRQNLFYDLGRIAEIRLAYALAEELAPHGVTALALTLGYMRTEAVLDHFQVREETWRDGIQRDATFAASETPCLVGRAVAALAADPDVSAKSGRLLSSWQLCEEYGFTDLDGSRPTWARSLGWKPGESPFGPPRAEARWQVRQITSS